jgi:hypothetical protein
LLAGWAGLVGVGFSPRIWSLSDSGLLAPEARSTLDTKCGLQPQSVTANIFSFRSRRASRPTRAWVVKPWGKKIWWSARPGTSDRRESGTEDTPRDSSPGGTSLSFATSRVAKGGAAYRIHTSGKRALPRFLSGLGPIRTDLDLQPPGIASPANAIDGHLHPRLRGRNSRAPATPRVRKPQFGRWSLGRWSQGLYRPRSEI